MTHSRKNRGVCSSITTVTLDESGIISDIRVDDGCEGNLAGLCRLLVGRDAGEAIDLLTGIGCEEKPTSCPDQIALCLGEALDLMAQQA